MDLHSALRLLGPLSAHASANPGRVASDFRRTITLLPFILDLKMPFVRITYIKEASLPVKEIARSSCFTLHTVPTVPP